MLNISYHFKIRYSIASCSDRNKRKFIGTTNKLEE